MNIETLREHCLKLTATSESFPFDNETLVFKVVDKMFCLAGIEHFESFTVKCLPERAEELREQYPAVQPGYHMNKRHWNTVSVDGSISDEQLLQWVTDSYELVVESLPKARRKSAGL